MILYIDTTDFNRVTFAAGADKKTIKRSYQIDPHKSHKILQKLAEFLKGLKIKDLRFKKIAVNRGPGSYTGVRVGVTLAMALGFAWGVPVRALRGKKFIIP